MGRISRKEYNALNAGVMDERKIASGENITAEDFRYEPGPEDKPANQGKDNVIPFKKEAERPNIIELKKDFRTQDDFNRIVFVSKALQKNLLDYVHAYKGVVHIEKKTDGGSIIVGTDGFRLHYAEISMELTPGEYKVDVRKNTLYLTGPVKDYSEHGYPDWRKLVKDNIEKQASINFYGTGLTRNTGVTGLMAKKFYSFIQATGKIINLRYLDDLTKANWDIYLDKDKELNSPVVFRQDLEKTMAALIMPMEPENG
jgi:hypothetical protein